MPGYSGRPLIKKLGLDKLESVVVLNAPRGYRLWLGPEAPRIVTKLPSKHVGSIHWFVADRIVLEENFADIKKHIAKDGMLWVSWAKKTSPLNTDLDDNVIREVGLRHGLVDVKVAAVSDDWSAMKFVYRLRDR